MSPEDSAAVHVVSTPMDVDPPLHNGFAEIERAAAQLPAAGSREDGSVQLVVGASGTLPEVREQEADAHALEASKWSWVRLCFGDSLYVCFGQQFYATQATPRWNNPLSDCDQEDCLRGLMVFVVPSAIYCHLDVFRTAACFAVDISKEGMMSFTSIRDLLGIVGGWV